MTRPRAISPVEMLASVRASYDAAKSSRFKRRRSGLPSAGSGADYHYASESDFLRLMEQSRDIDRNDPVVGQGISRLVDNVFQQGIKLDTDTGDREVDTYLTEKWQQWCENADACHSEGERTFDSMAKLALRAVIVDGDVVFLPLVNGTLQPVEAHRLRTPRNTTKNVVHGVLMDSQRKRLEYWLTKEDVGTYGTVTKVSEIQPFAARDPEGNRQVFHIYHPKRLSQTRGITALAPVVNMVGMHDDLQFATLVKAQMSACFAILRERHLGFEGGTNASYGTASTEAQIDGTTRSIEEVGPGMEVTGRPGEVLKGFSPSVPNTEYFEHVIMILSFVSVNLGIPVAVLLLDPRQTNFSGWRGSIDQARIGMRGLQDMMIASFHRPTFQWKVRQWLDTDPVLAEMSARAGVDIFRHRWNPPEWQYIEPAKDSKADQTIIKSGLNSRRGVLARRGLDIEVIDAQTVADNIRLIKASIEAATQINTDCPGACVDWREVAGWSTSPTDITALAGSLNEEDDGGPPNG